MGLDQPKLTGICSLALRSGYKSTKGLLQKAAADSDLVSVFVNGRELARADCAVFVVKNRDGKAWDLFHELVVRGLITEGKPVVEEPAK